MMPLKNGESLTVLNTGTSNTESTRKYTINEIFYSLTGEGVRAGVPSVFIRFSFCNMRCGIAPSDKSPGGWSCDTEFSSGRDMTLEEIEREMHRVSGTKGVTTWIVLTGGEPALQLDKEFIDHFHALGYKLAIETNGTIALPTYDTAPKCGCMLDWVCVSPKTAEHTIRQLYAHEVKYVRTYGQGIPQPVVIAEHYLISPAFDGDSTSKETLDWCVRLCLDNPKWRLSLQLHKLIGIR